MSIHRATINIKVPSSGFKEWKAAQARDDWETTPTQIHGFAGLETTKGKPIASPIFAYFGHPWELEIFPGGDHDSDGGMVAAFLKNKSKKSIRIGYIFRVKGADGCNAENRSLGYPRLFCRHSSCGFTNYAKQSKLLKGLMAETLIVEVEMKHIDPSKKPVPFTGKILRGTCCATCLRTRRRRTWCLRSRTGGKVSTRTASARAL